MIYSQDTAQQTAKSLLQINAIKLNPKNPFNEIGWGLNYCDNRVVLYPVRSFLAQKIAEQAQLYNKDYVVAGAPPVLLNRRISR